MLSIFTAVLAITASTHAFPYLTTRSDALPPNIPSASTASDTLGTLTVAEKGSLNGYSRALFPHWITINGTCNTREIVLIRDGTNTKTNSKCAVTKGTWLSPYDGATWTNASKIQIDHLVPLANAWVSGAAAWTTEQRKGYANDLVRPQLVAVTGSVNEAKSDSSPDEWKPPLQSFWCTYAEMWVAVKGYYNLTVTDAEKNALGDMLGGCQ